VQATLDLRIDYLRPAAALKDLLAEAECYRVTRHVAFVRGVCHQGDAERPVANLTATFIVADRVVPVGTPL
jgi:acyl-coenzyme A thioesterase PaaI-like protein